MKIKILCLSLLLTVFFCVEAWAQKTTQPAKADDEEVIKIDTELVEVPIVVTDKTGKPILNLKRTNFTVFEDGKPQEVTDFGAASAPFEVALLLDTSGSTRSDLQLIKRSAEGFINSLRPGDRVSIIAYRTETRDNRAAPISEVLSGLTDDRAALKSALDRVTTSNGTPYYDGLLKIVEDVFRGDAKDEFRGRRALVALTDGVDSTSSSDFDEARELLENSGITCYFIQVNTRDFFEENLLGDCESAIRFSAAQIRRYYRKFYPNSSIEKASNFCQLGDFERLAISKKLYELALSEMTGLAKSSGGKVFPAADISDSRNAFKSVAAEIGTKYSLGYYSTNEKKDGKYRKIKVELKGLPVGGQVRAREGYTAPGN